MTTPVRLLESSQNPAARELLRAAARERPRSAALRATALAVGVSSSVVATSATATAAAGVGTAALATPSLTLVAAKWLVVGTLGGFALAGTATIASDVATSGRTAGEPVRYVPAVRSAAAESETARTRPSESDAVTPSRTEAETESDAGVAVAAPTKPASSTKLAAEATKISAPTAPASGSLPAAPSLSREIASIDGARLRLRSGDASGALQKLDEYAALVRTGTLEREAQLLRVDALTQSGQRDAALALAERYLASYPNDPHAARLRALVGAP